MKKSICLLLLTLTLSFSCKKENNPSKTELLTAHCWTLNGATIAPAAIINGAVITDLYAVLPLCDRDNVSCLIKNGSAYVDEGPTKCDPNDPQVTDSGKWWFSADEKVVFAVLDGASDTLVSEILELTTDQLRFRQTLEVFGQPRQITFSYQPE